MLSWLFIKQKQYTSAFRQEKAIYKRKEPASVDRLLDLSDLALSLDAIEVAKDIFEFVLQQTKDSGTQW